MDRRNFFLTAASAGTICIAGRQSAASESHGKPQDTYGVLVDTTACIGCRKCEWACNESNNLPLQTLESFETKEVFEMQRRPDADHYTVVNEIKNPEKPENPSYVKMQCMHCLEPACYSACLVTAFTKTEDGAVVYNEDRCMGCRYCMVACPFQMPAYEYGESLAPVVQKCEFCADRTADGGVPACVEVCPTQCLTYGKRDKLIEYAHATIENEPDKYQQHIYGEHEAGGTNWMYISDRPFSELGLPTVGTIAPSMMTEPVQHSIFRNFVPPLSLMGFLGLSYWQLKRHPYEEEEGDETQSNPRAVGADKHHEHSTHGETVKTRLLTPGMGILAVVMMIGLAALAYRYLFGIGAVSNLTDAFPWGLWKALNVAGGMALAGAGFVTAAWVHIFHREKYEPLVRRAILVGLLGYSFGVLGLLVDLGRYYSVWHPMLPSMWSGHSVLFEVGMCVMLYLNILVIEFIPIVTERFRGRVNLPSPLRFMNQPLEGAMKIADNILPKMMMIFILLGVTLSCLHQSSLGALMVIAPDKMDALWYTPVLPLLFLMSTVAAAFSVMTFVSLISTWMANKKPEINLLAPLNRVSSVLLALYAGARIADLTIREQWAVVMNGSMESSLLLLELGLFLTPIVLYSMASVRRSAGGLLLSSGIVMLAMLANRLNVFLTAYTPTVDAPAYMPSLMETVISIGLIATMFFLYRIALAVFPILPAGLQERAAEGDA